MSHAACAHRNSPLAHHSLRLCNRILAEVENAGRQRGVGLADQNGIGQMFRLARPRRWRRPECVTASLTARVISKS